MATINEMKARKAKAVKGLEDLQKATATEKRPMTPEEKTKWNRLEAEAAECRRFLEKAKQKHENENKLMGKTIEELKK